MKKSFVIILIMLSVNVYTDNNLSNKTNQVNHFGQELLGGFSDLRKKINIWATKAEVRRRRFKKAFYKFINEAFSHEESQTSKNTINLTRYDRFSSESKMLTDQLITYHGYMAETHAVETEDGVLLTNFRILPLAESRKRTKVAIFLHGLMGSSDDWLLLGSKKALPYLFLDFGYDVWLINFRGNRYSKFHFTKQINTNEFWDFSFHEMGLYDLPAVIDYITGTISNKSLDIHVIGHSMGTTALLVLLSTDLHYNQMLKSSVLLAPLAFMHKIKGPFKMLAAFVASNGVDSLNFLGKDEFMVNKNFPEEVIEKHCRGYKFACYNPLLFLANGGKTIEDVDIFHNVIGYVPAGTSAKTIQHYIQIINSGKFEMFDYGIKGNLRVYGKKYPLSYHLSRVTIPMLLFSSQDDWLATIPDVLNLITQLPNVIMHHIFNGKGFSHTDFVWGSEAPEYLFHHIIRNLQS